MTGTEIRKQFLQYFADRGHTIVASSGILPKNDPTLMFANAGMNQFKDCFLGLEDRGYYRACSSQKCVRAGGKHNDLENVGRTARHHTFFEMLGNFSFGDYFKKEAIAFAWEFLTGELQLDKSRLYVTVYNDDDEAADIWHLQEGVPRERIFRFGEKDNFWSMGDTGPCGPCTEIFWDNGPEVGCGSPDCAVGCDCDRYMEIWNNVFMQFNRSADGSMTPLPKPSVDTGMGLERITTVMQGVHSNYDTDLLQGIIRHIERHSGKKYGANEKDSVSMRVIADHCRAVTFLICDGALPSNEGRGYVLRRIMRRAARHAKMLGVSEPLLCRMVEAVREMMGDAYPELAEREAYIKKVTLAEEERFNETLDRGLGILNDEVASLRSAGKSVIPGEVLFKLYDTYGFPIDLTGDIVESEGFTIDEAGFESCMEKQREQGRENWKGSGAAGIADIYKAIHNRGVHSQFIGYDALTAYSPIRALVRDGVEATSAAAGDRVDVIVESSPFYGESGGQAGDIGVISSGSAHLEVLETTRPFPDFIVHHCQVREGAVQVSDAVNLTVTTSARRATARNHTATHLLQTALRQVLGDHVKQAGSLVSADRLRFDFTHFSAMSADEIRQVETLVNGFVMENDPVSTNLMQIDEAIEAGATALFDEKYGDSVRVVRVGDISMELCGGTHVRAAGDIGLFKIVSEAGIAAGVRRIEALTGSGALDFVRRIEDEQHAIAVLLKAEGGNPLDRLEKLLSRQKDLQREMEVLQGKLNAVASGDLLSRAELVNGVKLLATQVKVEDVKALRDLSDALRDRIGEGVIVLGADIGGKANLLVAVTKELSARIKAGDLVRQMAPIVGGSGGGKPELAQAGGSQPENIGDALAMAAKILAGA
ncbi:MAG: alanine--tRNA ligase [Geobacteraceae bacterium GWC2_55_20]|nr:MAG: alanine--tRNA ligase [Geobacteraceae bacterium GWC2_55_20]OGU19839.1 MAG: alanine--tRNA ligase [Geobacteraceae bacterium GWF2_54_21]HBA72859.1 alanine--tRNA ligase [Geobacter sp.]HCE68519.1 alanine--tRNA ligase [Geobacter sp.]